MKTGIEATAYTNPTRQNKLHLCRKSFTHHDSQCVD